MLLAERTTSALPLSIGTSLALESLLQPRMSPYDPDRTIPQQINIADYDSIWINVVTLCRNLLGAIPRSYQQTAVADDLIFALLWEMETIDSIVKEDTLGNMKVVYYHNTYSSVTGDKLLHKAVKFRLPQTPAQHLYHDTVNKTMTGIMKKRPDVRSTSKTLKPETGESKALIITHMPFDLVSYNKFHHLHLLESHTGKLKTRKDWYTKYYPVGHEDMSVLPFLRKLLFIFGDHSLIHPMDVRFRKLILEIAQNRKFTPLTTEDKVTFYFDQDIRERYLFEAYQSL